MSERLQWLYEHMHIVHITMNDNRTVYEPDPKKWVQDGGVHDYQDQVGDLGSMIVEVQIYPRTPVGSYCWYGSDLSAVVEAATNYLGYPGTPT